MNAKIEIMETGGVVDKSGVDEVKQNDQYSDPSITDGLVTLVSYYPLVHFYKPAHIRHCFCHTTDICLGVQVQLESHRKLQRGSQLSVMVHKVATWPSVLCIGMTSCQQQ